MILHLLLIFALRLSPLFAATCTFTDGAWDATPAAGDDIVLVSGNLTWGSSMPATVGSWTQREDYTNSTVTFDTGLDTFTVTGDINLQGGTWTHTANPSLSSSSTAWTSGRGTKQLIVSCGGDFTIGPKAKISVNGRGFCSKQGPGYGEQGYGASHGGCGCNRSGRCYGSPVTPVTLGSGGRDGSGGGAIALTVGGALKIDGPISANSSYVTSGDYHSAGGSILLVANSISGTNSVTASCGHAGSQTTAGAGGRIAFKLTGSGDFSGFTGKVEVKPRASATTTGSCGSIYYETKAQAGGKGKLVIRGPSSYVDNGRSSEINEGGPYDFDEIVIEKGALGVGAGIVVKTKKLTTYGSNSDATYSYNSNSKVELRGGELRLPAGGVFSNVFVRVCTAGSTLACGDDGDLVIGKGCTVGTFTQTLNVAGDLTMKSGAVFEHGQNGSTDCGYGVKLRVEGDMTVDAGATITGTERGFNGAGQGRVSGCGASHGGLAKGCPATAVYGSVKFPVTLGSDCAVSARWGGGRVRISVAGCLTMNGKVEVTGGWYNGGSYSPAGGSVWIDAGTLAGSGSITASGGRSNYNASPGGGGRVAVYLTQDNATFDAFEQAGGEIAAPGGLTQVNSTVYYQPIGPCGTVYLSRTVNGVTNDALVVANRNSTYRGTGACIGPNVLDAEVGNVVFRTNGVLTVGQNGVLNVQGDWTRDPLGKDAFVAEEGDADNTAGTVAFVDATKVSTVKGTNVFARLLVATPGKTVKFGTATEALTKTHEFEISGAEENLVRLRSTTDGTHWPLVVYDSASVEFADVKDSDASSTDSIKIAAKDSTDSGNNLNWSFSSIVIGETITWKGDVSASWSNVANWDKEREPVDTDVVVIPAGTKCSPQLAAAVTLNSLHVESGATLSLEGFYLTVTNVLDVGGELVCTASEVVTASGPVVAITNFTCASSTLTLAGGLDQRVDLHSCTYNLVRFDKSGGQVTMADGFSCYQFYATPTAAMSVDFASGKTVSATDCYISAGSETPLATFKGASGGRWNLNVSRQGRIRGVALSNCAATGIALNDDLPGTDGGYNENWRFGGTFCQWTGASNANFTNEANWADGKAPDASSLVYFDGTASVTMTAPRTVREFQVASGTVDFAKGTNLLTVAENLSVESGATLSLTTPCWVTNNVILRASAKLTHAAITSAPGAVTNRLVLTVGGDMTVESGASVDVAGKGFYHNHNGGLGYAGDASWGPSHGGLGSRESELSLGAVRPAYDSVFAPIHPGSNCLSGDEGNDGGGVAVLKVGRTLTLNGSVKADGHSGKWYYGAGGSVYISAGRFVGSGSITANAGGPTIAGNKKAGGGRISVCLTEGDFSQWSGTMTAYTTWSQGDAARPYGGVGTIYLESASDGPKGGTIYLKGRMSSEYSYYRKDVSTPLYSPGWDLPEDFRNVKIVVTGAETVSFPTNVTIRDLVLTGSGTQLPKAYLQDHTVRIRSRDHRYHPSTGKVTGWTKSYSESVTTGANGEGRIQWPPQGIQIIVK